MNRTAVINFFVQPDYETERMTLINSEIISLLVNFDLREFDALRWIVKDSQILQKKSTSKKRTFIINLSIIVFMAL